MSGLQLIDNFPLRYTIPISRSNGKKICEPTYIVDYLFYIYTPVLHFFPTCWIGIQLLENSHPPPRFVLTTATQDGRRGHNGGEGGGGGGGGGNRYDGGLLLWWSKGRAGVEGPRRVRPWWR